MEAPAAARIGQTIAGRYRLLRQVGEGGVGTVYEAVQQLGSSPRAVAVKLLRPEWSQDAAVQARFHREAALVARLQHPNTVRIYDFGQTDDGTLFIAMEYLRGRSLQQLLEEQGRQPPERVQRIVRQVAASLQEAHDLGIVHRDLKPDNILIVDSQAGERDVVKLVDFGIAKGQPSSGTAVTKLTALGTFVGTPAYMSPEQFSGSNAGPESDIYSLGVTCFQMLSGRLPFDAQSAMQWAQAHLVTPAPVLAADYGAGTVPERMRRAVERALAKDPRERPASMLQFARDFSGEPSEGEPALPAVSVAVPAVPVAGGVHTMPMTRVPELAEARGVAPTLPNAGGPNPAPGNLLPGLPRSSPVRSASRARGWAVAGLGLVGVSGFLAFALSRGGFSSGAREPELTSAVELPAEPAPVVIAPEPPLPTAPGRDPERASERSTPAKPAASKPAVSKPEPPKPAVSKPEPSKPELPVPALPTGMAGAPALPPGVQLPEGLPVPPSSLPVPPLGLPLPPFSLPSTQGACQRCLDALSKGGNGSIVSAAAEDLLCDDRVGRERCETQMRDQAPGVAEQAARAGDCPAALATEAAGVQLGVSQERFRAVNALCVR